MVGLVVVFGIFLDGFLNTSNLLNLLRSVSALGILSVGMAIVVIARGMDLSLVASMGVGTAITVQLLGIGPADHRGARRRGSRSSSRWEFSTDS